MDMKPQKFLKLFLISITFLLSLNISSLKAESIGLRTLNSKSTYAVDKKEYVKVFRNGKWWIYVYENGELIDFYPE
jgi:hypothetical protein